VKTDGCKTTFTLLVADDDVDDQTLIREAVEAECDCLDLRFVCDGQELLDYLKLAGKYANVAPRPYPGLILLDLNMPRRDGYWALCQIKSDPNLKPIPVIIFTTTQEEAAVKKSYSLGADGFISKPMTFEDLAQIVRSLGKYWCNAASL
jgi:CheY-like chemotaxis protein